MATRDSLGLLVQKQSDGYLEGGDTVNWTGHEVYLSEWRHLGNSQVSFVALFERKKKLLGKWWRTGAYVRHPRSNSSHSGFAHHYKNPWNGVISRDQLTGIIAALIRLKEYKPALRLFLHHGCWLWLFSYNTIKNGRIPTRENWKWPDPTLMGTWAIELRMFGWFSWLFWPLLCVLDIHLLFATWGENVDEDDDSISYAMRLFISCEHVPTITTWLALQTLDWMELLEEINRYWSGWRGQPEMYKLYEKRLYKIMGD